MKEKQQRCQAWNSGRLLFGGRGPGAAWLLLKNPAFTLPLLLILGVSYGYAMTHAAVGVDDLTMGYYAAGGYYIQVGRLMGWLVYKLLLCFADPLTGAEWIAVPLMFLSAVSWSALLHRASEGKLKGFVYPLFACLFVSYPLINEIWCFSAMNIMVAGGYLLSSLALHLIIGRDRALLRLVGAAALMAGAVSMYESAAPVFVAGVCLLLVLRAQYGDQGERRLCSMLPRAAWGAAALALALALEWLVNRLALGMMNVPEIVYTTRQLAWGAGRGFLAQLMVVLKEIVLKLFLMGAWYLPVGEYAACCVLFMILTGMLVRKYGAALLLPLLGLAGATVLLPLIQGYTVEYRACQPMALFVSFTLVLCAQGASVRFPQKTMAVGLSALLGALSLFQGLNLDKWMRLDYRRYQEEAGVITGVCQELTEEYGMERPVVFVGKYPLSQPLLAPCTVTREDPLFNRLAEHIAPAPQSRKYVETNIQGWLGWAVDAFARDGGRLNQEMGHILEYVGYGQLPLGSDAQYYEAKAALADLPAWPREGCIRDMGDYIAVKLGPVE